MTFNRSAVSLAQIDLPALDRYAEEVRNVLRRVFLQTDYFDTVEQADRSIEIRIDDTAIPVAGRLFIAVEPAGANETVTESYIIERPNVNVTLALRTPAIPQDRVATHSIYQDQDTDRLNPHSAIAGAAQTLSQLVQVTISCISHNEQLVADANARYPQAAELLTPLYMTSRGRPTALDHSHYDSPTPSQNTGTPAGYAQTVSFGRGLCYRHAAGIEGTY